MDINALRCRNCGATIDSRDVHEDLAIAKCRYCSTVLDLARRDPAGEGPATARPGRASVPMPERFSVDEGPGGLSIEWRWFTFKTIFLIFFCLFWDGFLVVWYQSAFTDREWVAILFPVLHVAVGVSMTWTAIAQLFNRTRIVASRGSLRIQHSPLPWPGNRVLKLSDIDQLFCDETVHKGDDSTTYTYNLRAMLHGTSKRLKLIGSLDRPDQALFLEQQLERFLGIEDRPVHGELSKGPL
ncbi:MAG: hypothetical protein QM765_48345 [Myxococcales bacterium]